MQFKEFAEVLQSIELESSRNKKTEILANFLKKLSKDEYRPISYLLNGRVVPIFISLEYNFSLKLMLKSLGELFGDIEKVNSIYNEGGDIGLLVEEISEEKQVDMNINEVFDKLLEIAKYEGKGSQKRKMEEVRSLIQGVSPISGKYISRMIIGKLRLGINYRTVLDAISWAIAGDKSLKDSLVRAYGVRSDLGEIMYSAFVFGVGSLKGMKPVVGLPMASKLVEREKSTDKIFQRLGDCIIQPKYDGLRAQIHFNSAGIKLAQYINDPGNEQKMFENYEQDNVLIYSRNMEDLTKMFPDIVQNISKLDLKDVILDSEVIGYDSETGNYLPFQETIQRKRKYGVSDKANEVPIKVIIFDCLFINGEDITGRPLVNRLSLLREKVKENEMLKISESFHAKTQEDILYKFNEYMSKNLEGLIAKNTQSEYEPGTRNYEWIKLKVRTEAGSVDSLDLVILGYYRGTGARAKFGIGALLAGIYDRQNNVFISITKIGTGITDQGWVDIKKSLDEDIIESKPDNVYVDKMLYPDVWVEPKVVSVVEFDEITKSKSHSFENVGSKNYGFSLRFPRLKQFGRDKSPTDASTIGEVEKMYNLQY